MSSLQKLSLSPSDEQGLIKLVDEVEHDVVIGHDVEPRTGELPVYQDNLKEYPKKSQNLP